MRSFISRVLMDDLTQTVQRAFDEQGVVNVSRLAEEVRQRNESENVALEDIEASMLAFAETLHAAMEFDSGPLSESNPLWIRPRRRTPPCC